MFLPKGTPNMLKVVLPLLISIALVSNVDTSSITKINDNYYLISYILNEVLNGIFLGLLTNACFMLIKFGGQLIDIQMGLSMVSLFDPNSNSNTTLIENLFSWLSIIIFFAVDAHHLLIKALSQSFNIVNLGSSIIFQSTAMIAVDSIIQYFIIGLKIGIPIVLVVLMADIIMGLISRTVPQLNVMILGMPLKILIGFGTFLFALPIIVKTMTGVIQMIPDIYQKLFNVIPMAIFVFASEEKTEEATAKKKGDSRKKGQVAKSKDLTLVLGLLAATFLIIALGNYVFEKTGEIMTYFLSQSNTEELTMLSTRKFVILAATKLALIIGPFLFIMMITGVVANYMQVGFLFTFETMKPKLSKINPIEGFKRMFSTRSAMQLVKDSIVVIIMFFIGYTYMKDNFTDIINISRVSVNSILPIFLKIVTGIFTRITIAMVVLAAFDFVYQRYMHNKDLKMTKQEVKEEFKQSEGDPQIKGKIRQKQREMSMRRMMQAVPQATVVVTNPTHISVAIKYDDKEMEAPKVVAKGADYMALKIKELAKQNNIPIIENKPLARLMYEKIDIDKEIPYTMYETVAEVLALVYKMNNKKKR
jgi:flagellar biosynthetic protein FliR/FlhB